MRALPIGVPKVMVSTLAGGDVSGFTGSKDIVMIPSIVDISGINRITREVLTRAAGAVCGMASGTVAEEKEKPAVACTMFGNTTIAVNHAKKFIEGAGYEVVVFPCTGASGRAMEDLINSGHISGVLDITLTEWADELAGGVLSAGPKRLDAASKTGIPQVVVPGCLDMVNFWAPETIPEKYRGRKFYRHNPNVTLMRTNIEENKALGEIISEKLNKSRGKVCVFLPLRGLSMIDAPGGHFWWPEADQALFDALKKHLHKGIDIISLDYNINDEEFACECAKKFLDLMNERNISGYNA
jgi:uncharacterized protein (UPF0261 family)